MINSVMSLLPINTVIQTRAEPVLTYQHEIVPYLKESNAYGNIYFSRYFEWQGMCREMWFCECIFPNMFEIKGALVTKFAHNDYEQELFPFQKIICLLNSANVRRTSFELMFRFYSRDTNQLVARGTQKIGLVDTNSKRPIKIPTEILEKIRRYAMNK
ncbi:MAG: thioesterase family protein [Gammaproteobacteria bacterium]|nr:thioesterase family protein [Gammaproteobacteria bacterium]